MEGRNERRGERRKQGRGVCIGGKGEKEGE